LRPHRSSFTCPPARDPLSSNFNHLQSRFVSSLVDPLAHAFPGDTVIPSAADSYTLQLHFRQMPLRERTILLIWIIARALTPSSYRRNLIEWGFVAISRPAVVRTLLRTFTSLDRRAFPTAPEMSNPIVIAMSMEYSGRLDRELRRQN
jgi:hypothetical protein